MKIVRGRVRTTKWNLFFHYVSIALMMVSGIFLVPLYLKFIPLGFYGAWLATGNILVWLTAIDPGLSTVLQQRVGIAYGKQDFQAIREFLAGGLCITATIVISIVALGFLSADHLPVWLNLPSNVDASIIIKAFCLAVIGSSLMIFSFSITAANIGLLASLGIGIIFVAVTVLGIVLTVVLLYSGFGLLAIPIGAIFRGVGLTLGNSGYLLWRLASEKIGFSLSFRKVPDLVKLMSYTFLGRAGVVAVKNVDLFIVSRFLGPECVPVLHLTRSAPEMSKLFIERPAIAFMPAVSHLIGAGEIDKARAVLLRLVRIMLWVLGLCVGGFVALNDDFVRLWVGSHLFAGQTINLILCGTLLFAVTSGSLASLCFAVGNIKGNSLASLAQSLLFIPLVILGAKYLGLLGVVLAPLISVLAVSAWYYPRSFSQFLKLLPQHRKDIVREILKVLVIIVPLTLGFGWLHPSGWFQFIVLTGAFCFFYGFALYLDSKKFRLEIMGLLQRLPIKFFKRATPEKSIS